MLVTPGASEATDFSEQGGWHRAGVVVGGSTCIPLAWVPAVTAVGGSPREVPTQNIHTSVVPSTDTHKGLETK